MNFRSILGCPPDVPRRITRRPKGLQDGNLAPTRRPEDAPNTAKDASKTLPRCLQNQPGRRLWAQGASKPPTGLECEGVWEDFGMSGPLLTQMELDFERLQIPFWKFLGSIRILFLNHVGPVLLIFLKAPTVTYRAGGVTRCAKHFYFRQVGGTKP